MSEGGELVHTLQKFSDGLVKTRDQIRTMKDEELIELYNQLRDLGQIAWVVRCMVLGEAKTRTKRGEGAIKALAGEFGISTRMAQYDILVYDTFIKDDPEFRPTLSPGYYLTAAKLAADPVQAIQYAEERSTAGKYSASEFARNLKGEMVDKNPAPSGLYRLEPVNPQEVDETDSTKLYGHNSILTIEGELYVRIF